MTASSRIAVVAAACGASALALGAFGAHALRNELDAAALQTWHTAVEYQFWHVPALLAAAFAPASPWRSASAITLALGIFVFCGSLYALALGAPRAVGAITPLGGICFLIGWFSLAAAFWRTAK